MRLRFFLNSVILFAFLMVGCNSTKSTVSSSRSDSNVSSNKNGETNTRKELDYLVKNQSDVIFDQFLASNGSNLNSHTLTYINDYKDVAIKKMQEYKIPASITLAQGILESGNGRSELTRKANNHFGIKCHKDWTGKKVYHDDDQKGECFRKYTDPEGSFNDHSLFLTTRSRYDDLFKIDPDNYKKWAHGLKDAGYATDRKYPHKLIKIIEDYELYAYDDLVLGSGSKKNRMVAESTAKYVIVNKGDTLYSIAKNNQTSVDEIKVLNDLSSNSISIGQRLLVTK